jgi:deoxyadenosine/deoxycytidine kinase
MKYNLITVEGNIGAGKTTLTKMLATQFAGKLILEEFEENPFLPKFFEDFKKMAFATELYFMAERYHQLQREMQAVELFHERVFMDYVFQKSLLYAKVNLSEQEYKLFQKLFEIINPKLPEPDLIIYVHSQVDRLVRNIHQRGRDFEQGVDPEYLKKIEQSYFQFFKQKTQQRVLILDCTEADFVAREADYKQIAEICSAEYEAGMHHFQIG